MNDVDPGTIAIAGELLRSGGIVAFPTETVYGLGANAFDARACARVFEVKERPEFDPLIVHLADASELSLVADAGNDPVVQLLIEKFWPGPLTLVLPKAPDVPGIVTAGLDTVAVRVPAHPTAHNLIAEAGVPIAAPSANKFGSLSPTRAEHVDEDLGAAVDLIIDGGPATWGVESTIVSISDGKVHVLRLGAITVEDLEDVAGAVDVIKTSVAADGAQTAPGQLDRHYAPRTPMHMITRGESFNVKEKAIYLAFQAPPVDVSMPVEILSPDSDLREAASRLFEVLHEIDHMGATEIVAEWVPDRGLGRAINDRLRRAAVVS